MSAKQAALVIGAGGGLGLALVERLRGQQADAADTLRVYGLGRGSEPALDITQEDSVRAAAETLALRCQAEGAELRLLVVASGFLHGSQGQPERSMAHLNADYLQHVFAVNAIGPALVMKYFLPLMPRQGRTVAGFISAKVGSIGDNALGGWYGYRASKAALNQLVKTAAIEMTRHNPASVCVALHPGTVDTALSRPFAKTGLNVRPAAIAAGELLDVLDSVGTERTGCLVDYRGDVLPW
ncbi:MAG: SDR family NAD(P)-dependent oxidoreductase [Pseudomonadota bacterium]